MRRIDAPRARISFGESVSLEVVATLNGLDSRDVVVEVVFRQSEPDAGKGPLSSRELLPDDAPMPLGEHRFVLMLEPELCGKIDYRIRCFPRHDLLTHRFEPGLMAWL